WLSHLFGKAPAPATPPNTATAPPAPAANPAQPAPTPEEEKKKGLLDRVFGIFGGKKQPAASPKPQP
ncbi:MAG: hypothetical protein ACRD4M_10735, partial [Candidatus Acidiferrales bacterium]